MLAQLGNPALLEEYEERGDCAAEKKLDGTRAMLVKTVDGKIMIPNRRNVDYAKERNLPELEAVAHLLPPDSRVDGEIINAVGPIDRIRSQRRCSTTTPYKVALLVKEIPIKLVSFDILRLNGVDLTNCPFSRRKDALKDLLSQINHPALELLWYETEGFRKLFNSETEGLMIKRVWARYMPGIRSDYWLKCKHTETETVSVAGWTKGEGAITGLFGSLVCVRAGQYVGNVGSGFTLAERRQLTQLLEKSPSITLSPKIVGEVKDPFTAVKAPFKLKVTFSSKTQQKHNFQPRLAEDNAIIF